MKHIITLCAMLALLSMALPMSALAADTSEVCYPTSIVQSEDKAEIRKAYDLAPDQNPDGIPRSDFEQDGYRYTLIDLLKQELPENEQRQHVETVTLESKNKDMASVLALLPQEREFITEDGLAGVLTLKLDSVSVEPSGYGSSTKQISATRSFPNLIGQDTSFIPKSIESDGRTLMLQNIDWQTDNTANVDGYAMADRYTAVATYSGSKTTSYVKGYTVTADYVGTVSRIVLDRTRYVAIFEGTPIKPVEAPLPAPEETEIVADRSLAQFPWQYVLVPVGVIAIAGAGVGIALSLKRRNEDEKPEEGAV